MYLVVPNPMNINRPTTISSGRHVRMYDILSRARSLREAFKNYLADFLTKNCRKFSSKNGSKRAKIGVFWPKIAVF